MDAKDIVHMAKKDLNMVKDLVLLFEKGEQRQPIINVIVKITNKILENKLKQLGLKEPVKKKIKEVVCFRCQEKGHVAKDCKGTVKCKHCMQEHFTRECPTRDCKDCGKRHPPGHCRRKDKWCKWCRVWGKHETKECPNGGILKRLTKLEKMSIPRRPNSTFKLKRFQGLVPRGNLGVRKRKWKPRRSQRPANVARMEEEQI
jgi:hypothetical protein